MKAKISGNFENRTYQKFIFLKFETSKIALNIENFQKFEKIKSILQREPHYPKQTTNTEINSLFLSRVAPKPGEGAHDITNEEDNRRC